MGVKFLAGWLFLVTFFLQLFSVRKDHVVFKKKAHQYTDLRRRKGEKLSKNHKRKERLVDQRKG